MIHSPIPSRIRNSDPRPVANIPLGQCFVILDGVFDALYMAISTRPGEIIVPESVRAVDIKTGQCIDVRDVELVVPASGAFVSFTAGTPDKI